MAETLRIDRRFRGPPDSGNGGYVCGLVAKALGGSDCEVTLHAPPPLDRTLRLQVADDEAQLLDGESRIASAKRTRVDLEVPKAPPLEQAKDASKRFTGWRNHIFPACFVCGPERAEGDGLRIFAGASNGQVAAPWTPDPSMFEGEALRSEFIWAALDCPGYFAVEEQARPALLGRLAVRILDPRVGQGQSIVTGWPIASEGRKHLAGTALHAADGQLVAYARATWIRLQGVPA